MGRFLQTGLPGPLQERHRPFRRSDCGQGGSGVQISPHIGENALEHFGREPARIRVVARAMITIEEAQRAPVSLQIGLGGMSETGRLELVP